MSAHGAPQPVCCPVSQEPYASEGPQRPCSLPCGHSLSHAALAAVLSQQPAASKACPICRAPLHLSSPSAYPTNYTVLDLLAPPTQSLPPQPGSPPPYPTQLPHPRSAAALLPTLPHISPLPDDADPAAADPAAATESSLWAAETPSLLSAAAVAELFPQEAWLQRRVHLPVSVVDLLPALQGMPVAEAAWMQVVARYRLPQSMLSQRLQVQTSSLPGGVNRSSRRAYLAGDPGNTPLGVLYTPPLRSSGSGAAAADSSPARGQAVSLPDLQAAVLPHVVLQLLPGVWRHMQPLLGYIVSDDSAAGVPHAPRVGHVYAELGARLPEYVKETRAQQEGAEAPPHWLLVVDILRQLSSVLTVLHSRGICLSELCPIQYSTVFLHAAPAARHSTVLVSACAAAADASNAAHVRRADALCTPPEEADGHPARGTSADVWRVAATALLALAADQLPTVFDRRGGPEKSDVLRRLCADAPCDLFSILQSCLQDDPSHRWTAAHMSAALASIPAPPAPPSVPTPSVAASVSSLHVHVAPGLTPRSDSKPWPTPAATPAASAARGPPSAFSAAAPSTPQSAAFREVSLDFARIRMPQHHVPENEIFGIAAPVRLPPTMHVVPKPKPQDRGCRCKVALMLVPTILIVIIPVLVVRWSNS